MIAFTKIDDLNKVLREQFISQSELFADQVLNALSVHGEDLSKLLDEQTYVSIDKQNALMLFELRSRKNDSDMSQTENDVITYYRSFDVAVILYGDDSSDIATRLVGRFRTEEVRQLLRDKGVYLESIDEPETLNEYKNETMWLRNDIHFYISCKFEITKLSNDLSFEEIEENII